MAKPFRNIVLFAIFNLLLANFVMAQIAVTTSESKPTITFSGLAFGDFFWNGQNNNPAFAHMDGFWLRRTYITADLKYDDRFSSRIRIEMKSNGDLTSNGNYALGNSGLTGTTTYDSVKKTYNTIISNTTPSMQLNPFIKDLWIKYKTNFIEKDFIMLGLQPTPAFEFIDNHWGYRQLERTPLDMTGLRAARDFGVSWQGEIMDSKFKWNLMYGNNSSLGSLTTVTTSTTATKTITGSTSRIYFDLQIRPIDKLCIELIADDDIMYSQKPPVNSVPQIANKNSLYQAHFSWTDKDFRIGAQYSMINYLSFNGGAVIKDENGNNQYTDTINKVNLVSLYAVYSITPEIDIMARYDNYNSPLGGNNNLVNPKTNKVDSKLNNSTYGIPTVNGVSYIPFINNSAPRVFIFAVAYNINKYLQIIPSIQITSYKDKSFISNYDEDKKANIYTSIVSEIYGKITFYWKW